ncbi:hypothetical protein GCM10010269_45460 [Streptomyces humidus]|uniref:Uncharacterized protein n=1 Tax=Streptomyces humidus TaxID=52259 RepID=A0A918L537_9ACTN|nr:hypothetical protein [Streptomyces humidus]GGS01482.1 hypothetical protein GCM10010269_45460 [Streptomyces humidus]
MPVALRPAPAAVSRVGVGVDQGFTVCVGGSGAVACERLRGRVPRRSGAAFATLPSLYNLFPGCLVSSLDPSTDR